jgi:histidinol-phosphate/aromatic aminotransferase/cobyric acid decarboxylase-like protein/choline kinase
LTTATTPTRAIILAAGRGNRLGLSTRASPKPLIEIADKAILHRTLENLAAVGVETAVIVVGHMHEQIREAVGARFAGIDVTYVMSEDFRTTNNIYSLWLAREHLTEDVLLLEADIVYRGHLLRSLLTRPAGNVIATSPWSSTMDGTVVTADPTGRVARLFDKPNQGDDFDFDGTFKTVNISLLRREYLVEELVPDLDAAIAAGNTGDYYESVFRRSIERGRFEFHQVVWPAEQWFEIDDHTDRDRAEFQLADRKAQLRRLNEIYGSYWRYPVIDHALLYNLHFPPRGLKRALARDMDHLIAHYPSGQRELARLASLALGLDEDRLAVANGGSELIRALVRVTSGPVIIPVPGFNEYENSVGPGRLVRHELPRPSFELDVDALAAEARRCGAKLAIVVSPNNPTSLAVPAADLRRLCRELASAGCTLLLDESFVDFCADPARQTLAGELDQHPNLVILKSMSKVYGIGGLRLGYLASADTDFVDAVRADLPIWNVNGFAESFLRLLPRFLDDFTLSCRQVRVERDQLYHGLVDIDGITAWRPDANFVMVELTGAMDGRALAEDLFTFYGTMVKHCAGKSMVDGHRFLRIASRTAEENYRLLDGMARLTADDSHRLVVPA